MDFRTLGQNTRSNIAWKQNSDEILEENEGIIAIIEALKTNQSKSTAWVSGSWVKEFWVRDPDL